MLSPQLDVAEKGNMSLMLELNERQKRLQRLCEAALREEESSNDIALGLEGVGRVTLDGSHQRFSGTFNQSLERRAPYVNAPKSYDELTGEVQSFRDPDSAARASSIDSIHRAPSVPVDTLFPPRSFTKIGGYRPPRGRTALPSPQEDAPRRGNSVGFDYTPLRRFEYAREKIDTSIKGTGRVTGMVDTPSSPNWHHNPHNLTAPTNTSDTRSIYFNRDTGRTPPPPFSIERSRSRSRSHSVPVPRYIPTPSPKAHLQTLRPPPPPTQSSGSFVGKSTAAPPRYSPKLGSALQPPPPENPRSGAVNPLKPPVLMSPLIFKDLIGEAQSTIQQKYTFSRTLPPPPSPPSPASAQPVPPPPSGGANGRVSAVTSGSGAWESYKDERSYSGVAPPSPSPENSTANKTLKTSIRSTDERIARWRQRPQKGALANISRKRSSTTPPPTFFDPDESKPYFSERLVHRGPKSIPPPGKEAGSLPPAPSDFDNVLFIASRAFFSTPQSTLEEEEQKLTMFFNKPEESFDEKHKESPFERAVPMNEQHPPNKKDAVQAVVPTQWPPAERSAHPYDETASSVKGVSGAKMTTRKRLPISQSSRFTAPQGTRTANTSFNDNKTSVQSARTTNADRGSGTQGVRDRLEMPIRVAPARGKDGVNADTYFDEGPEQRALRQLVQLKGDSEPLKYSTADKESHFNSQYDSTLHNPNTTGGFAVNGGGTYRTGNEIPGEPEPSVPERSVHAAAESPAGIRTEIQGLQKKAETLARHLVRAIGEKKMLHQNVEQLEVLVEECNFEVGRLQRVVSEQVENTASIAGVQAALRAKEREVELCEEEMKRLNDIVESHVLRLIEQSRVAESENMTGLAMRAAELEAAMKEVGVAHVARAEAEERADQLASELEGAVEQIQLLDQRLAEMERATAAAHLKNVRDRLGAGSSDSGGNKSLGGSISIPSPTETVSWPLEARRAMAGIVSHAEGLLLQNSESSRHASMRMQQLEHTCQELRRNLSDKNDELHDLREKCVALHTEKSAMQSYSERWFRQLRDIKEDATLVSEVVRTSRDDAEDVAAVCMAAVQHDGMRAQAPRGIITLEHEKNVKTASFARQVMKDLRSVSRFLFALREMEIGEKNGYQILLSLANGTTPDRNLYMDQSTYDDGRVTPVQPEEARRRIREKRDLVIEAVERALRSPFSPSQQHLHKEVAQNVSPPVSSITGDRLDHDFGEGNIDEYIQPDALEDEEAAIEIHSELRFSSRSMDRRPSTGGKASSYRVDNGIVTSGYRGQLQGQGSQQQWEQQKVSVHPQVTVLNQDPNNTSETTSKPGSVSEVAGGQRVGANAASDGNYWSPNRTSSSPIPTPPSVSRPLHLGSTPMPEQEHGVGYQEDDAKGTYFEDRLEVPSPTSSYRPDQPPLQAANSRQSPFQGSTGMLHVRSPPTGITPDESANLSVSDIPFEHEEDEELRRRAWHESAGGYVDHQPQRHSPVSHPVRRVLSSPPRDDVSEASSPANGSPPRDGDAFSSPVATPPPAIESKVLGKEEDYSPVIQPSYGNSAMLSALGKSSTHEKSMEEEQGDDPTTALPTTAFSSVSTAQTVLEPLPKERSTTNKPSSQSHPRDRDTAAREEGSTEFFGDLKRGAVHEAAGGEGILGRPESLAEEGGVTSAGLLDDIHALPSQQRAMESPSSPVVVPRPLSDDASFSQRGLPQALPPLHPGSGAPSGRSTPAQSVVVQLRVSQVLRSEEVLDPQPRPPTSLPTVVPNKTIVEAITDDDEDDYEPSLNFFVASSSMNSDPGTTAHPTWFPPVVADRFSEDTEEPRPREVEKYPPPRPRRLLPGERSSRDSSLTDLQLTSKDRDYDTDEKELPRRPSSRYEAVDAVPVPRLQRSATSTPIPTETTHTPDWVSNAERSLTPFEPTSLQDPLLSKQAQDSCPMVRHKANPSDLRSGQLPATEELSEPEVVIQVDEDELLTETIPDSRYRRGRVVDTAALSPSEEDERVDMAPSLRSTTATPLSSATHRIATKSQLVESPVAALSLLEPSSEVPAAMNAEPQPAEPLSSSVFKPTLLPDRPQRAGGVTPNVSALPRANEDEGFGSLMGGSAPKPRGPSKEPEIVDKSENSEATLLMGDISWVKTEEVSPPVDDRVNESGGDPSSSAVSTPRSGEGVEDSSKRREDVAKILERLRQKKEDDEKRRDMYKE